MRDCKRNSYTLEMKSLGVDGAFAGYASVFNNLDSQRDIVRPGAFAATLRTRKYPVQLLWQHQWDAPIGVITSIFEDRQGLYVEGRLLMEVAKAREAYALLKARAVRGLSIGFTVKKSRRDADTGARELLAVDLWEVSLVTLPANDSAQVTVVKTQHSQKDEDKMMRLLSALTYAEGMLRKAY